MIKQYFSKKAAAEKIGEHVDRGYHSGADPYMDEQSADMYEMVI